MLETNVILLMSVIFAFCEPAAIVEKINKKCGISDNECLPSLYKGLLQEISDNGIPEMDIPIIDPLVLKNVEILALGMIKITIVDGAAKGFKNCYATNFKNDIENQRTSIDFVCDVFSIEGSYKVESTPTLLALTGGINVHGEGKGAVVVEKVQLSFDFAFEVKKLDDGEIHMVMKPDNSSYTFKVLEKATFSGDNLFVGKQEISAVVINIFNENWDFITNTFGKYFIDKALEIFFLHVQKFFGTVPAKDLFTDDLTPYIKS